MFEEFSAVSLDDDDEQRKRKDETSRKSWRLSFANWLLAWDRQVCALLLAVFKFSMYL